GAEPGAEAEEQHGAGAVAADRLHGRVVDDAERLAERGAVVEARPHAAQVVGIGGGPSVPHHAGVAHRDDVVGPAAGERLDPGDHAGGGEGGPGGEAARRAVSGGQDLDVAAADVDHQDLHAPSAA